MKPFTPRKAGGKVITVTASNQRAKLTEVGGAVDVLITNADTQEVFIEFGGADVVAVVDTGTMILPGSAQVFQAVQSTGPLYYAAIGTAANSKKIQAVPGSGI